MVAAIGIQTWEEKHVLLAATLNWKKVGKKIKVVVIAKQSLRQKATLTIFFQLFGS